MNRRTRRLPLQDELYDLVAVDRVVECLAYAHILQHRIGCQQSVELRGESLHREEPVLGVCRRQRAALFNHLAEKLARYAIRFLELSGGELRDLLLLRLDEAQLDPIEIGELVPRDVDSPVIVVPLQGHPLILLPAHERERPGADEIPEEVLAEMVDGLFRIDVAEAERRIKLERGERDHQVDHERRIVHNAKPAHPFGRDRGLPLRAGGFVKCLRSFHLVGEVGGAEGSGTGVDHPIEAVLHIRRLHLTSLAAGEGGGVVEENPFAEMVGVDKPIGAYFPPCRKLRSQRER
jgi:hypothetical protein